MHWVSWLKRKLGCENKEKENPVSAVYVETVSDLIQTEVEDNEEMWV